ncbi:MAG: hypothetical protein ACRDNF_25470, partial [Streptosporangiaceae bacterium]
MRQYIFTVQALTSSTGEGRATHEVQENLGKSFFQYLSHLDDPMSLRACFSLAPRTPGQTRQNGRVAPPPPHPPPRYTDFGWDEPGRTGRDPGAFSVHVCPDTDDDHDQLKLSGIGSLRGIEVSQQRLAKRAAVGRASVSRAVTTLADAGYLVVSKRPSRKTGDGYAQYPDYYRLVIPGGPAWDVPAWDAAD